MLSPISFLNYCSTFAPLWLICGCREKSAAADRNSLCSVVVDECRVKAVTSSTHSCRLSEIWLCQLAGLLLKFGFYIGSTQLFSRISFCEKTPEWVEWRWKEGGSRLVDPFCHFQRRISWPALRLLFGCRWSVKGWMEADAERGSVTQQQEKYLSSVFKSFFMPFCSIIFFFIKWSHTYSTHMHFHSSQHGELLPQVS